MHDKTSTGTPTDDRHLPPLAPSASARGRSESTVTEADRRRASITAAWRAVLYLMTAALSMLVVYLFWVITMMGGGWYLLIGTIVLLAPVPTLHLITRRQHKGR
ncbi:hypothetical protein [Streptomyces sp. NPDC006446]|uniref:hypothetical protein n=1 Tax=Streptomyces sp. NPDC006446 TaxID=3154301 RepID=UPI0033A79E2B